MTHRPPWALPSTEQDDEKLAVPELASAALATTSDRREPKHDNEATHLSLEQRAPLGALRLKHFASGVAGQDGEVTIDLDPRDQPNGVRALKATQSPDSISSPSRRRAR